MSTARRLVDADLQSTMMPPDDPLVGHLLRGETLAWRGRPQQGLMFTPSDGLLIPFSLFWGGFAIFWEVTATNSRAPGFFPLFGVPFVLIGLFLIFGRFLVDSWLRSETFYAVTDRRVLIARTGWWPSFQALTLDRLPELSLKQQAGGRGTIRFGPQIPMVNTYGNTGFGWWVPALDPTPQFLGIDDVRHVFAAVQERSQTLDRRP